MGTTLGPKYILYSYMDPLGLLMFRNSTNLAPINQDHGGSHRESLRAFHEGCNVLGMQGEPCVEKQPRPVHTQIRSTHVDNDCLER